LHQRMATSFVLKRVFARLTIRLHKSHRQRNVHKTLRRSFCASKSSGVSHAVISAFDMFSIGIGPSSSHTVGPMRASKKFVDMLDSRSQVQLTQSLKCELFGSLALTGIGHGTDYAVLMGLEGEVPESIDPSSIQHRITKIGKERKLNLRQDHHIEFIPKDHLLWHMDQELPFHPNGIRYTAYDDKEEVLFSEEYYSVGGGFVIAGHPDKHNAYRYLEEENPDLDAHDDEPPYMFNTADELLRVARALDCPISEVTRRNEMHWRSEEEITEKLLKIWAVMDQSIENGVKTKGLLKTKAKRRAADMYEKLTSGDAQDSSNPLSSVAGPHFDDWLYCWSMAVNEENSMGGRVVTAPTNGASGVIPAVIKYYKTFHKAPTEKGICDMLLTAASIGMLYKKGASLSAAEVGCQGEIGVASSMAAAALCEAMGGSVFQVANAAEIAMEHSLGLTCDPVGGYVEIPCIERNALGATKAVNSARLAMFGDGRQMVSLDQVIRTMKETGDAMSNVYKETSLGGLAVNVPVC